MSITPSLPQSFSPKSFWDKTEGTTGKIFLALAVCGIGAALFLAWGLIVPFVLLVVQDTFMTACYLVGMAVGGYLLFNKQSRTLWRNLFQSTMRAITGIFVTIDPIGILKNTLDENKAIMAKFDTAIERTCGAKQEVEDAIAKKKSAITHDFNICQQADVQLKAAKNPLEVQRLQLSKQSAQTDAGMKKANLENLLKILNTVNGLYDRLQRLRNLSEFNISTLENQIEEAQTQRHVIMESFKAMNFAKRLLQGDPEQLKLFNQSLEYLAEDNASKLGAMKSFSDYAEKYITHMDLENGAASQDAQKMFDELEKKLLTPGTSDSVPAVMDTAKDDQGVYQPVPAKKQLADKDWSIFDDK